MTLSERLKEERKKAGLSQKEFAEKLGLNARTYASYERGERDISTALLLNICKTLEISSDVLLGNTNALTQQPDLTTVTPVNFELANAPISMKRIAVIGEVAAGYQCLADMQVIDYVACDASLLHTGYEYVYLRVRGDSMEPELHEDDLVLVQVQDTIESGEYAVVLVDNEDGLVKKIEIDRTHITLISENPYYPPRRFEREEMNRIRIFGKVVSVMRRF